MTGLRQSFLTMLATGKFEPDCTVGTCRCKVYFRFIPTVAEPNRLRVTQKDCLVDLLVPCSQYSDQFHLSLRGAQASSAGPAGL